ncbi:MAG: penicillin-binding protein 2 [Candidatus Moranbacteria bacterium]|nr:penicillin-binding protein 2 [Candidatus Moranbacteria bacterium]OIQ01983.1 MAG: hypothetical protein AUK58_03720 [Candidatus Moranbacteria bacterium CG2_30_41_165]PIP25682.1 MAG: penicillin-binding protein [Candidatus Moranbacteria bacterium CG23_combo_of_CG06-09_8_20_14_all_41_28]PIV86392.1 MAG: penicillin-binding protein 2 [Candidatus Moranbacteria bacterium CG17_big_fil_post_rev_8_21_14_2_50_41_107]PIW93867.1 MAG: penicillin-binding protein 2 [Candidatus Moranbacteria bacterium CG_4_8_14
MQHPGRFQSSRRDTKKTFSFGMSRVKVLFFVIFFMSSALVIRLYFIQVMGHEKWSALAENQHTISQELSANRGEIYIHDGNGRYPLGVNREYQMVYASPKDIIEKDRSAIELSRVLGVEAGILRGKFDIPDDPFEVIKKRLNDNEVDEVKALHLKGIGLIPEKYRYYPGGNIASQVIGFTSVKNEKEQGMYGIEASQDALLRGETGTVSQERDASGRWLPLSDREVTPSQDGKSLLLTIDRVIQYETEKLLKESVELYAADSATAVVMDPKTGSILSMASFPQFDPNAYSQVEDFSLFMNKAVSASYEPGSIMKPITMAMGIEEGKVSPGTEFTDPGSVTESGYTIHNSENKSYGRSTMTKVLEQSINTGVIFVEKLVGNQKFAEYLSDFGFGEKTGIELPAELSGNINNLKNIKATLSFFTASFGQGIAATPIQMLSAYAALANEGKLMKPRIIDRIISSDGEEEVREPEVVRQVVSKQTSEALGKMLRSVVVNGHGKKADVPGYLVGGKTGTAQVAKTGSKGYEDGMSIGSFVGYAPINDPKFVVLVKLDNPKNVEWAESSAAPTFGKIMKFLLEYAKIKPTEDIVIKK